MIPEKIFVHQILLFFSYLRKNKAKFHGSSAQKGGNLRSKSAGFSIFLRKKAGSCLLLWYICILNSTVTNRHPFAHGTNYPSIRIGQRGGRAETRPHRLH
ncbi:MAG: hypothetical protein J6S82_09770, partial [Bacteroidales bacterium]|nr:hypothetical protein [Bacteroidales bacterium]